MPVAPHENNEVRLVLGGHKPIAAIEKAKQPIGYALALSLGATGALHVYQRDGEVLITKPNNALLINEYMFLLLYGVQEYGIKEYHRRMGKMFGYSEQDIEYFIKAEIHCNCEKCTGVQNATDI